MIYPRRLSVIRLLLTLCAFTGALRGLPCQAVPLTVLHTFGPGGPIRSKRGDRPALDGARPFSALLQGRDGALYGTTANGGAHGSGTVFRVSPDGTGFTVLHSFDTLQFGLFAGLTNSVGAQPVGTLVQASDGTLYGAAEIGGSAGSGLIFRLQPDGAGFQVIHSFGRVSEWVTGRNGGGAAPEALTLAADGLLYGVAFDEGPDEGGVIFKLNQDGKGFQVLHAFRGVVRGKNTNEGGAQPEAAPVFGSNGALYGTTISGGKGGCGVIYRMTAAGGQFTVLHHFQQTAPGFEAGGVLPEGSLTASTDGFLYGSTRQGGTNNGGTLFKIRLDGTGFAVLHTFSGASDDGDGRLPAATPILGRDGRLYGLTGAGGANAVGAVFWASTDGTKFSVIHDFGPPDASWHNADGAYPRAGLLQGRDGALYGVAAGGGSNGTGTVFRLLPPQAK